MLDWSPNGVDPLADVALLASEYADDSLLRYHLALRAVTVSPFDPRAWKVFAEVSRDAGQGEIGVEAVKRALEFHPISVIYSRLHSQLVTEYGEAATELSRLPKDLLVAIEGKVLQNSRANVDLSLAQSLEITNLDRIGVRSVFGDQRAHVSMAPPVVVSTDLGNHALHFDGRDDYVHFGKGIHFESGDSTVEAWIKISGYGSGHYRYILNSRQAQGTFNGKWFALGLNSQGSVAILLSTSDQPDVEGRILNGRTRLDQEWNHIALVKESGMLTLYVNGELDRSFADIPKRQISTDGQAVLGSWASYGRCRFEGAIDELRLWTYARSHEMIKEFKDRVLTENEPGLLAYYDFNQGVAGAGNSKVRVLLDRSGNENHGALRLFALDGTQEGGQESNWVAGVPALGRPLIVTNDYNGSWDASGVYPLGTTKVRWTVTDGNGAQAQAVTEVVVTR